jgi:phosphatidate cytidylyltransferase
MMGRMLVRGRTVAARRSDLVTRALAGGAMIVVALGALLLGGLAFWLLASAAAMLMLGEWAGLMRSPERRIAMAMAMFALPIAYACPIVAGIDRIDLVVLAAAAGVTALIGRSVRLGLGLVYAGLPTLGLIYLRDQPNGLALALWTLAIVWATDIGAYFAGRSIGGPRLAPRLSPNKTWAGLGGGVLGALCIGALIASAFDLPRLLLVLGAPLAVLAQAGDLFESWLKRRAGVKDSGRLLPGHGGALDRLDGVVPVAAFMACLTAAGAL